MPRLAIKILNTNAGTNAFTYGVDTNTEWVKKIDDLRKIVNPFVEANPSVSSAGTYAVINSLQMLAEGYVIGIIAVPSGVSRAGDNIGAFLFVPYDLYIDSNDNQLAIAVKKITEQITSTHGYDPEVIKEIVSREYQKLNYPFLAPYKQPDAPEVSNTAVVQYDALSNFYDFIGYHAFSAPFFFYKNVLFVSKAQWPSIPQQFSPLAANLGNMCLVSAENATAQGFSVKINGASVKDAVYMALGSQALTVCEKAPFAPVQKTIVVNTNTTQVPVPSKGELKAHYTVKESEIVVKDSQSIQDVKKPVIKIDGKRSTNGDWRLATETVTVSVAADGYEPQSRSYTREEIQRSGIRFTLTRQSFVYNFTVDLEGNGQGSLTVNASRQLNGSPLRGYKANSIPTTNYPCHLSYSGSGGGGGNLQNTVIIALLAFVIGAAIMGGIWMYKSWSDSKPKTEQTAPENPTDPKELRNLLDKNNSWTMSALEKNYGKEGKDLVQYVKEADYNKLKKLNETLKSQNLATLIAFIEAGHASQEYIVNGKIIVKSDTSDQDAQDNSDTDTVDKDADGNTDTQDAANITATCKYLDKEDNWYKNDLEKTAPGLFDAINTINCEKLLEYGNTYKDSRRLSDFVTKIIEYQTNYGSNFKRPIDNHLSNPSTGNPCVKWEQITGCMNNANKWKKTTVNPSTPPTTNPTKKPNENEDGYVL